jgi:hypothetical protein
MGLIIGGQVLTATRYNELISITEKNYGDGKENGVVGRYDIEGAITNSNVNDKDKKDLQELLNNFKAIDQGLYSGNGALPHPGDNYLRINEYV